MFFFIQTPFARRGPNVRNVPEAKGQYPPFFWELISLRFFGRNFVRMQATPPAKAKPIVDNPSIRQQKLANAANNSDWLPPSTRPEAEQVKQNIQELQDLLAKNGKWSPEQKEAVDSHIQSARAYLDACKAAAIQEIPRLKEIRANG